MTFLELCQRLRMEAGIAGSGPTSTDNQIGEALRLVEWVKSAYQDIQDKNPDWWFLRADFTFTTVFGLAVYPLAMVVSDGANWKRDSVRCYDVSSADEQFLYYRPWDAFRDSRLFGSVATQTGRPHEFSINPAKEMVLWPVPESNYTVTGEYFRKAQEFVLETDVPVFERYQLAIVYNALMRYAAYAGEPALYAEAQRQYGRLINKLELDYRPEPMLGGALA